MKKTIIYIDEVCTFFNNMKKGLRDGDINAPVPNNCLCRVISSLHRAPQHFFIYSYTYQFAKH